MMKLFVVLAVLAACVAAADPVQTTTAGARLTEAPTELRGNMGSFNIEVRFDAEEGDQANVAFARFTDDIATTGMGKFEVKTSPNFSDEQQAYAAGVLEGAVTAKRITQMFANFLATDFKGKMPALDSDLVNYMQKQLDWMDAQTDAHKSSDDAYWTQTRLILKQMDGIVAGYNMYCGEGKALSRMQILMLNAYGDLEDIELAFPIKSDLLESTEKVADEIPKDCSAMIRVLPGTSDVFVAHDTWTNFSSMLRIFKHYHLNYKNVESRSVSFSAKPGMLSSKDDFYVMHDTKMVSLETTNGVEDQTLLQNLPTASLPCWVRVILANRLAADGKTWTDVFAMNNSGTYNNQFMAVDMKVVKPGQPIPDNFLWINEQMPGYTESADVSEVVRQKGFWSSFNVPYLKTIYEKSGFVEASKKRGDDLLVYDKCPRYLIFERESPLVTDMAGMKRVMRLNDYKNDPLSHGNPTWAIASRYDLLPADDKRHMPFGAVDAKIVSYKNLMGDGSIEVVSGPTHDDQPAFSWNDWPGRTREGHPDTFDFGWQHVKPTMQ